MKIHRVRMQGFGPYRDTEVVDFDAFDDDGIFLITGRTGAGKTSVLDAVTYALFGRIPRYDGTAGEKVRSDHLAATDRCEVEVDLTVAAGRFRVRRSPAYARPKQRGEGLTTVAAGFELAQWRGEEWEVLETKLGNAERRVSDIVPLSAAQFQQVILLAQGQFQEFLVADSKDRQALLSKLFDTSRFTAYADDLYGRARELRVVVAKGGTRVETQVVALGEAAGVEVPDTVEPATGAGLDAWLTQVRAEVDGALAQSRAEEKAAAAAATAAAAALATAKDVITRQERLAVGTARRAQLLDRAVHVESLRDRVEVGRRAALAQESCRGVRAARAATQAAEKAVVTASVEFEQVMGVAPTTGLADRAAEVAAEIGSVRELEALEAKLPGLERAATRAEGELAAHAAEIEVSRTEREQLLVEAETTRARTVEVAAELAESEGAALALEAARAGLAAAREHEQLVVSLDEARQGHAAAAAGQAAASVRRSELLSRRFAEYAGVLAAQLEDGAPCAVCGSAEHPAKASSAAEPVTEEALQAAEDEVARAEVLVRSAGEQVSRVEAQLEAAALAAGARPVGEWTHQCLQAEEQVTARSLLQREAATLTVRLDDLSARIAMLTTRLEQAGSRESALNAAAAAAAQAWKDARAQVDAGRGEHQNVALRMVALRAELSVTRAHLDASSALEQSRDALVAAEARRDEVLKEQQFGDEEEALAALLDPDELHEHDRSVREHDREMAEVEGLLSSPELIDVPTEAVDVEPLAADAAEKARAASAAAQRSGAAEHRAREVRRTAEQIESDLAATSTVRRELEVVSALADTLRGNGQNDRKISIEAFALAAELEEIVAAANLRLQRMTGGRYEFRHSDAKASGGAQSGLALEVLDAHTGEGRSPRSLSGGEKFQASLALALGLAEVVTARSGGLRLDTLFIDEGFGTLDPETLESTMATLDSLREGGRTIGLISHVAAMKEAIAAQLHVDVTAGGWSTIRQR